MKSLITLSFCLLLVFPTGSYAQKKSNRYKAFAAGNASVSLGIGLLPTYLMDGADIVLPPLTLGADYMVSDIVSLGLQAGHSESLSRRGKDGTELVKEYHNNTTQLGLRFAAHCTKWEPWDFYGGLLLGYNMIRVKPTTGSMGEYEALKGIRESTDRLTYSGFLGLRHSCCGRISFFGEIGFGISLLHVGVSYHLSGRS